MKSYYIFKWQSSSPLKLDKHVISVQFSRKWAGCTPRLWRQSARSRTWRLPHQHPGTADLSVPPSYIYIYSKWGHHQHKIANHTYHTLLKERPILSTDDCYWCFAFCSLIATTWFQKSWDASWNINIKKQCDNLLIRFDIYAIENSTMKIYLMFLPRQLHWFL